MVLWNSEVIGEVDSVRLHNIINYHKKYELSPPMVYNLDDRELPYHDLRRHLCPQSTQHHIGFHVSILQSLPTIHKDRHPIR